MFSAHPSVVITGASSGLDRKCALHLARLGFRVFTGIRRADDAEALAAASPSDRLDTVLSAGKS
jgi:NAD(P)-dependent dehydrogenase (short-subunit alcohol dehydrogenase family)